MQKKRAPEASGDEGHGRNAQSGRRNQDIQLLENPKHCRTRSTKSTTRQKRQAAYWRLRYSHGAGSYPERMSRHTVYFYTMENMIPGETEAEKWRTANIEHLWDFREKSEEEKAAYGTYWYKEHDRKLIVDFTGSEKQDINSAVLEWQQYEKTPGETEVIDAAMSLIPDIPKDFEKWAFTDAVPQYMYYEYGKRIGLCTCCGKHHELKEQPKYGKEGTCPGCKRKVQYRTYKKKRPDTTGSMQH